MWRALTTGERVVMAVSGIVLTVILLAGIVLVASTPFQTAQTDAGESDVIDSDDDGLSDAEENLVYGTDAGVGDTSKDGLPDGWAARNMQTDPDTGLPTPDPGRATADDDPDDDGLTNLEEYELDTDPWRADTSGDGFHDGFLHAAELDPTERHEPSFSCAPDGMTLQEKWDNGLDACAADTDEDGLRDREELDGQATVGGRSIAFDPTDPAAYSTGGSGLADGFAVYHDLDPTGPNVGRVDHDDDGLTTAEEARYSLDRFDTPRTALAEGLDPQDHDTDGDGMPDGWEITNSLDPLQAGDGGQDPDGDGLVNRRENAWDTDPTTPDTDGDGLEDGTEVEGWTIVVNGRERRVSSNPLLEDTAGNGLTDLEEREGEVEINGTTVSFPPTDPRLPDTDADDLDDFETVRLTFGPEDERLLPNKTDTAGSGIPDGEELDYWRQRRANASQEWPEAVQAPEHGECQEGATAAIQAQDPTALGPGGDPDGDCIPNVLDAFSSRNDEDPRLPPGTEPLRDGDQLEPPERKGRQPPSADPALVDTDGDGLDDEWELRWARFMTDADGQPAWILNPQAADSDADGVPDAASSFPGKPYVENTPACWETIAYPDETDLRDATGVGVPWRADHDYPAKDEMDRGTHPLGSRACDTDQDTLVDGWEDLHLTVPGVDPLTERDSRWTEAKVATACYPLGHDTLPSFDDLRATEVDLDQLPEAGDLATALDEDALPPEDPADGTGLWTVRGTGCSWTGEEATQRGSGEQCDQCRVIGYVATLDSQQWHRTDPAVTDTSGDGGPDAWKILWYRVQQASQLPDQIKPPRADDQDPSGATMGTVYETGASPLVQDTDGDGTRDRDDDDPLAPGAGQIRLSDKDGDHLLDDGGACNDDPPLGLFLPQDADREQTLRDLQIIEVGAGEFLCEPTDDPNGDTRDADRDGVTDALELLATYNEDGTPGLMNTGEDPDNDGIASGAELALGEPADWPERVLWWFGSDPFTSNGYDADGDDRHDALLLDPDPFENLPREPTPADAWQLACDVAIVCPSGSGFAWQGTPTDSSFDVTIQELGEGFQGDRLVTKDGTNMPATVEVTQGGNPAADVPVAFVALTSEEGARLLAGDLSPVANAPHTLCIARTGADGTVSTQDCTVDSSPTSADLTGTDRTWTGTSTPTWERDLSVLDPTTSDERGPPENQDKIAAWAMGIPGDPGAADAQAVLPETAADVAFTDLPETAASGAEGTISARALDGAGDPLTDGELTLTLDDTTYTATPDASGTASFDVTFPTVDDATDLDLTVAYSHSPATYVAPDEASATLRVLPTPDIALSPPARALAGGTAQVDVTVTDGSTGVEGPLSVELAGVTANTTAGPDGSASVSLAVPEDARPGTGTLAVTFLGTDSFGETTVEQDVPVKQRLQANVTPDAALLGGEQPFSVRLVDLAGRAPQLDVNVTATLGGHTARATLPRGETLTTVTLPVEAEVGEAAIGVRAHTDMNRKYAPLSTQVPLNVTSPAFTQLDPQGTPGGLVPRGATVALTANVTDELDRPVPEGTVSISWAHGEASAPVRDGTATLNFSTPADAEPRPIPITWTVEGPGIEDSQGTEQLRLQVETELDASASIDPVAGTITVDATLTDDRGEPLAGETLNLDWALGERVQVQTDAEGRAQATLVVPNDAEPGDASVAARFPGGETFAASEKIVTVPIRAGTTFEVPEEITWNQGKRLQVSGSVVAAETGTPVAVPVNATHGSETVASAPPARTFQLSLEPSEVAEIAGDARQFTLELTTPGDDKWAPAETTVLVQRRVPVSIVTDVNRTEKGVTVNIQASTPDGPLSNTEVAVGGEKASPLTVRTDEDGKAQVHLTAKDGTLVVRYDGDEDHGPAQARVNLAEPAAPTATDYGWLAGAAILALLAVDAWIVYRVIQRIRVGEQVEEVLEELEEQLVLGDEVQASIYHAYMRLKAIAEVLGEPEDETETVREFGERFVGGLDLDPEPVRGLIGIFEQAWYGEVDPGMRTDAIEELRELQDHLRERGLVG